MIIFEKNALKLE